MCVRFDLRQSDDSCAHLGWSFVNPKCLQAARIKSQQTGLSVTGLQSQAYLADRQPQPVASQPQNTLNCALVSYCQLADWATTLVLRRPAATGEQSVVELQHQTD